MPCLGKHPHERGEDFFQKGLVIGRKETPPRAWGRQLAFKLTRAKKRNTPTSVGKTFPFKALYCGLWKHPHERGEDPFNDSRAISGLETPPRAWGRLRWLDMGSTLWRNTPTSVGKTLVRTSSRLSGQKHPHERGEDTLDNVICETLVETPPRAWGRPFYYSSCHCRSRNTPTSVGKTFQTRQQFPLC